MIDFSKVDLRDIIPYLPAAFGALLGNRYKKEATFRERLVGWVTSMTAGYYLGGMIGGYFNLGEAVTYGLMFSMGSVGTEIVAYVISLLREGALHPTTAAGAWVDIILGRRKKPEDEKDK